MIVKQQKVAILVPYFGTLPRIFPLWLQSCAYNAQFTWYLFTDDQTPYAFPSNVKVIYTTFKNVCDNISSLFSFKIYLPSPWGLCAFRPAFGHIFAEYLKEYSFWGYCDVDVIFGNLSRFITNDILNNYDKVLHLGHLSIYRNTEALNQAYMLQAQNGQQIYKDAFTGKIACFDEIGINAILEANDFKIYRCAIFADFVHRDALFNLLYFPRDGDHDVKRQIFCWKSGILTRYYIYNGQIRNEEYAYIHFCRRPMRLEIEVKNRVDAFCMVPNKFVSCPDKIDKQFILNNTRKRVYWAYWLPRLKPTHIFKRIRTSFSKEFKG